MSYQVFVKVSVRFRVVNMAIFLHSINKKPSLYDYFDAVYNFMVEG